MEKNTQLEFEIGLVNKLLNSLHNNDHDEDIISQIVYIYNVANERRRIPDNIIQFVERKFQQSRLKIKLLQIINNKITTIQHFIVNNINNDDERTNILAYIRTLESLLNETETNILYRLVGNTQRANIILRDGAQAPYPVDYE